MKLVIVHYHLRPGGIRRVIELATPHLVRASVMPITGLVVMTGERADRSWHEEFARRLPGVAVEVFVRPCFRYLSEQRGSPTRIARQIREALGELFSDAGAADYFVWAHNLGVGRNLLLARELAAVCGAHRIPLVAHHHDWWFDHRWVRWPEMRRAGFRTLAAAAATVFPPTNNSVHVAINHADAAVLTRHFGSRAAWLPNLAEPAPPPSAARVRVARRWLRRQLAHEDAPVWLLPCRTLRRKNIAEALLLTRWLRPEAWLVVTGAASSAEEQPYLRALEQAAHRHQWRLRPGVLAGDESRKPTVAELLAASEVVLLTSLQEGFGLPFLEAATARRPLIARRLPNVSPDLDRFGFRFPQAYDEILIAPGLFDWGRERARQETRFGEWRSTMPALARRRVRLPPMLANVRPHPVPFSRLTLAGQLEVLSRPPGESWSAGVVLNPFLEAWRRNAGSGKLRVTPWPRRAKRWLGGAAYAHNFYTALALVRAPLPVGFDPVQLQSDFMAAKFEPQNLYPLLWCQHA